MHLSNPKFVAPFFLVIYAAPSVGATVAVRQSTEIDPPTKEGCSAHLDHYDCEDGGWCELNAAETEWECFGADGSLQNADGTPAADSTDSNAQSPDATSESEETTSGSTCVIHGGHTHGDCSNQCDGIDTGEYNQGLHIAAIFIMLISSGIGVFFPILFRKWTTSLVFREFFFAAKHFGSGVIVCTALIHLLYHAFIMFNNACIADRLAYEPIAPAIALAALLFTFFIDYAMGRYLRAHHVPRRDTTTEPKVGETQAGSNSGKPGSITSQGSAVKIVSPPQEIVNVQLLEAGIIFHSVMIGVSLGATGGTEWVPLLCAIVFHQMFEGLGLGTRIAELVYPQRDALNKFGMGIAFSLITPIGVAIGVGAHSSYNPNSVSALAAIGVLDALSAGILLYAAIVEMLAHDFIHGELRDASALRAASAFFFVVLGAFGMAIIGKWA